MISLALKVLNRPAEGRPGISGTPKLGETLTADTSGITDPDGIPDDKVFTYQWVFFDVVVVRDIAGATGPSYTITRDREGDVLGVRVGFADSRGFDESVTSGPVVSPQSGDLWVAALTVGRNAALDQNGFGEDFAGGALTDATFSHAGKDYTFNSISHDSNGRLRLVLEPELTELDANLLDFYVRVHPYHFSNRSGSESNLNDSGQALIVWADAALIWSQGDVIRLALKAANQPAGGTPVIKGAPRVDDVLTADASGITDGNGIPGDVVFSYQWFDGATLQDIPGATGASLPLDSSHLGLTIGVRVGFTDAEGYEESVPSDATAPVAERAHKFWTATLTATQLSVSVVPIVGYPAPSFPGSSLTDATVTYGPNTYSVEVVQLTGSDETALFVRFSQAPTEGEIDTWILDVDGREFLPSRSTTPADSEPDRTLLWENSGLSWSDGEVISLALKVLNQPAQGRPSISGTRKFGETLTAGISDITDPNGIPADAVFTYQWFSVVGGAETDIPGANGPGYTIPRDQEVDFLRVRVGFTDSHGFDESVTSEEVVWRKAGEIWAALLTVGYNPGPNNYGFGPGYADGSLSETLFRYFNKNLTIFRLRVNNFDNEINLILRPSLSEEEADVLTFRAGSKLLAFSNRASKSTFTDFQSSLYWSNFGLSWAKGDKVRVALSAANQDHAGTAVLRGETKVGRILTVDPSGITDPNGIPDDVVFTYQWVRCAGASLSCEEIPGAKGSSYQLTEADKDSYVGVRFSFHDTLGYLEGKSSTVVGPVEARSSTVGQHLLDSANTNPTGVWGDAGTIWVAEDGRRVGRPDKIFAYRRSDLSRDSSRDFDTLHANNDNPFGIWSDGETMFVVERGGGRVYAYRMKDDPNTPENEFGAHDPDKDITLDGQNAGGVGIWATNSETIWVANQVAPDGALDKIFAYRLADDPNTPENEYGARDAGRDFNGLNSAGNNDPRGIWSDGDEMFVVNNQTGDYQVYAYRMSDGTRFPRRDIALDDGNGNPRGAWGDGGELWVADDGNAILSLFRYFLPYPATGQPTIEGNLVVGQTLTADVSGIADRNGLPDAFDYQWYRSDGTNDTPIDGATRSSYLLTGSDLGGSIRVEVSFFDGHSYEEALFSDRTRPLNAPATGAPLPLETARVLSASLIAGYSSIATGASFVGYFVTLDTPLGSLSPSTFTAEGTSYAVDQLYVSNTGVLVLSLDKELDADFTLTLGDASFSSGSLSSVSSGYTYAWNDSGLSWGDGAVISVSLQVDVAAQFPEVGDTLLAGISDIDDRNGLPLPDAFAYQWSRYEEGQGTPISGATEGVYVLAPEDTGHRIGFRVYFTDDDGFPESLDSSLTPVVNDPAKGKPTISGDLEVGQTLMADASAVTDRNGLPAAFTYQWYHLDGNSRTAIQGATGSTYTLVSDDRGHRIMVRVTFTDGDGFQEEVDSVPTMGVELINQPATGKPTVTVSGDLKTGSTLTADISGIADPNGLPDVFSYQWSRGEGSGFSPIPGAMGSTYILAPEDGGLQIRVKVTFTDDAGFLEEGLDPSDPTSVVNDPAGGQPVIIIGELRVGGRLTADTSGITDRNGLLASFTYSWFRSDGTNETPISGLSSRLLTLTTLEAGHRIKVEVSFTDQDGFSERVKSEFTPKVGAINHEATGKPTITGDLETGAELTAATTGIQDQNGLPATFAYQWFRSDGTDYAPIDEATESTYILASGDVGRRVKVRVTFTDNDGFSESLESDHTSPVAAKNIAATGKPTISGELRTGAILEVDISGIRDQNGLPDTFAYQWFRSDGTNETPIDEATKSSYTLASEDGGQRIKVQVTFTDGNGFSESRDSDPTAVINHSATGRPTITGNFVVGETLTADTSGIADLNGLTGTFAYQWRHGNGDSSTPIAGATGSSYALTESDKGRSIRIEVSFVDSDGNQETLFSDSTQPIDAVNHTATGVVLIDGVLETGKTLRAVTTGIADRNGVPDASFFRYQWFRGTDAGETEINGATHSDYNLVSEDAGHHVKVRVSFTDRDGFEESIASAFTQGTVLQVSVLITDGGYAPRKLTFLHYVPVHFLSWRNPSRAPYPSYNDNNEVVHRFEVQQRTRDLAQAWTGWEGLSLAEPPLRDSYNAVRLVVDGAERCQDREWRVRTLYNDPQRHSEWVTAGEHNRPADGPPEGAVPDVAGSWLTLVDNSYQLGFSWRTVPRTCAALVTGWDVERRHHLGWWFGAGEPNEGQELQNRVSSDGNLHWDSNTMTLDGNNVWTRWVNPYEGDGEGAGPQADDRLLTHSFKGSIDYQYRLRSRNEHGPSPWSMPMMFALGIRGQGHYVFFRDR